MSLTYLNLSGLLDKSTRFSPCLSAPISSLGFQCAPLAHHSLSNHTGLLPQKVLPQDLCTYILLSPVGMLPHVCQVNSFAFFLSQFSLPHILLFKYPHPSLCVSFSALTGVVHNYQCICLTSAFLQGPVSSIGAET